MTVEHADGWETVRRQVAICGRVTSAATGEAVSDADVWIVEGPHAPAPPATVRPGGVFFFLDLPPGRYVIAAESGRGRLRGNATGEVSWDGDGNVRPAVVDLTVGPPAVVERPHPPPSRTHQQRRNQRG